MQTLQDAFTAAMFGIYQNAKAEAGYNATIFLKMIHDQGGQLTAKQLINAARPSDGYTHLFERGRLDLTVEALVVETACWHELSEPEEIAKARRRLSEYGYKADHI